MQLLQIVSSLYQFGERDLVAKIADFLGETADRSQEFAIVANIFANIGNTDKAILYGEKAIEKETEQDSINQIRLMLYPSYKHNLEINKALECLDLIEKFGDENVVKLEKSICLYDQNKKDESLAILKTISVESLNDRQKIKYEACMGPHYLRNGEFKKGLRATILAQDDIKAIEINHVYHGKTELPLEFWEGTPDCKKLIVYLEAGLGDEIINIRFLNNLKKQGIKTKLYNVFYEDPIKNNRNGFLEFYEKNGFEVIRKFDPEEHKDYKWTYSQYLPILLGLDEKDLWSGPYLKAKKKKLSKKFNIGLRWSGNKYPQYRNFYLKEIYDKLKDLDVTFYSIQKDICMEELKDCPEVIDLSGNLNTLSDLADYINSFDLLITCPTLTCTIAGGLDKDCIVMTPCSDYYIFNFKNNKTPWFGDNMTLLRQKSPKIWKDTLPDLKKLVKKYMEK